MKKLSTVGAALSTLSAYWKWQIGKVFWHKHGKGRLNDDRRLHLEQCIFDVQNDLEHKSPKHKQVEIMNKIRNELLDDVGSREPLQCPRVLSEGNERAPGHAARRAR